MEESTTEESTLEESTVEESTVEQRIPEEPVSGEATPETAPLGLADPYRLLGVDLAEAPQLDPVAVCLPESAVGLESVLRAIDAGEPASALDALRELSERAGGEPAPVHALVEEILLARLERGEPATAARRIDAAMGVGLRKGEAADGVGATPDEGPAANADSSGPAPDWVVCAGLERARSWLRAGRPRHAGLNALRALHAISSQASRAPLWRAALFYRAESFYRDGQPERATPLYEEIADGVDPIARAALLRLADIEYGSTGQPENLATIALLLSQAEPLGTTASLWSARRAEWLLRRGDAERALFWLDRATVEPRSTEAAALEIRRADILHHLGRVDVATDILRRLGSEGGSRAIQRLAMARLFDWSPEEGNVEIDWAAGLASAEDRRVAGYVRGVRAGRFVESGDLPRALDALVRLIHDGVEEWLIPDLRSDLDATLAGIASLDGCDPLVGAIGGRRSLLMRHTSKPAPFLQLSACYLELGMSGAALETVRNVTKTFGPSVVAQVALPAARARFASGRTSDARAAAAAGASGSGGRAAEEAAWRLLYAEILLLDGDAEQAFRTLAPDLASVSAPPTDSAGAPGSNVEAAGRSREALRRIEVAIRATSAFAASADDLDLLRAALARVGRSPAAADRVALIQLALADLHRDAGANVHARALYSEAIAALEPGPFRSRATYWLAALSPSPASSREIWAGMAADTASGADAWSRVATNEVELQAKRAALGSPADVSADRRRSVARGSE